MIVPRWRHHEWPGFKNIPFTKIWPFLEPRPCATSAQRGLRTLKHSQALLRNHLVQYFGERWISTSYKSGFRKHTDTNEKELEEGFQCTEFRRSFGQILSRMLDKQLLRQQGGPGGLLYISVAHRTVKPWYQRRLRDLSTTPGNCVLGTERVKILATANLPTATQAQVGSFPKARTFWVPSTYSKP